MDPAPESSQAEGSTTVYETTIAVVNEPPGMLAPDPGSASPLDAHHKMLYEGSILSSHFKSYQEAITKYITSASKFMHAADDFILSAGQPAKYEHKLTSEGQAAAAATAAAAAPAPAGADESAFAAEAAQPSTLPLQGPVAGYYTCPSMPGSPALGAAGLTQTGPADILLPKQHEALFRHDMQRKLIAAGGDGLTSALQEKLAPAFKVWLGVYDECRGLLPEVERLRRDAGAALHRVQEAKEKVLEAEASSPLVSGQQLQEAGQLPRVLLQGTAGGLVAAPAGKERQQMYQRETEYTDAALAFELAEKVLRDKLGWLMQAGAGLKGTAAAALGHALRAAAAEGQPGQAPGGTAAAAAAGVAGGDVALRAPGEELLEPFPAHVLARLSGQHLPTLQQVVLADANRLARWGQRCRAAIAAAAGATAAAAGAQMLAAAAAPAGAATALPTAVDAVMPAGPLQGLARTDDAATQQHAGQTTAAAELTTTAGSTEGLESTPANKSSAGSSDESSAVTAAPGSLVSELKQAAAASNVPLELLAAAVGAEVQQREVKEAAASRDAAAWHLLHDASVVAGKEEAVLLPAVLEHLGRETAERLQAQHKALAGALTQLGQASPAAADFDLALLEALEAVDEHIKELEFNILPALDAAPSFPLHKQQQLAKSYRRAAAAAPTRPHGWFLGAPNATSSSAAAAGEGGATGVLGAASTAVAATKEALKKLVAAPVKAGVAAVDAAADVARFGPGKVPQKL